MPCETKIFGNLKSLGFLRCRPKTRMLAAMLEILFYLLPTSNLAMESNHYLPDVCVVRARRSGACLRPNRRFDLKRSVPRPRVLVPSTGISTYLLILVAWYVRTHLALCIIKDGNKEKINRGASAPCLVHVVTAMQ